MAVAEVTRLNVQLERRAVRAEDRLHASELALAKAAAAAEAATGPPPSTPGFSSTPGSSIQTPSVGRCRLTPSNLR